jgi:hypothetical protein
VTIHQSLGCLAFDGECTHLTNDQWRHSDHDTRDGPGGGRRDLGDDHIDLVSSNEIEELLVLGTMSAGVGAQIVVDQHVLHIPTFQCEKHVTSLLMKLDLPPDDGEVHRRVRAVLVYLSAVSDAP